MTYLIGDQKITLAAPLSPQEEKLIKAHPGIFSVCLNAAAHQFLLSTKKLVHLYTDIIVIYSTLLSKIPNYDDIRIMTAKTRVGLTRLEADLNSIFGSDVYASNDGWEEQNYETTVKKMAVVVVENCVSTFDLVYKTICCIGVFFSSFDNLKKLLVPCLPARTRMVGDSLASALTILEFPTIAGQIPSFHVITPTVVRHLERISTITSGLKRENKLLEMVFSSVNPSLQQYTAVLLGKAILKRDVLEQDCQIVHRREICYQAAEHVVSIPLTGTHSSSSYVRQFTKHIFYFFSAILVVVIAVLYRLYNVVFG